MAKETKAKTRKKKKSNVYNFKFWQELGYGILVTIIVGFAQAFVQFDPTVINDWQFWLLNIVAGIARTVAVLVIKSFTQDIVFTKE